MKTAERQQKAYEQLTNLITKSIEFANDRNKSVHRAAKWFSQAKKYIASIKSACDQLNLNFKGEHPQLKEQINESFQCVRQSLTPLDAVLSPFIIKTTEKFVEECSSDIVNINNRFKQLSQTLATTFDDFYDELKVPISYNTSESIENGFKTHYNFLQYINSINELEQQFIENMSVLCDVVSNMVRFESELYTRINAVAIANIPLINDLPKPDPLEPPIEQFEKYMAVLKERIAIFRIPQLPEVNAMQFEKVSKKMRAKRAFDGVKVGEIAVKVGDIVELINPTYADWYKVRTVNGMEGFVPATYLVPAPVK